jgi:hypothetical protein
VSAEPPVPKPGPWVAAGTAALLAGLGLIPGGPLDILPWPLAIGLVVAATAGWGLAWADRIGTATVPARTRGIALESVGVFLIAATFLLIKLPGIHASGTDDNIYFYMADAMTKGRMPYRDFFFSHPPVHLMVPAALFGIGGFSIGLAKSIPVVATLLAGLFLYCAARRASRGFALLVLLFHLTAYQVLMAASDMNGENLMTAFLAAGLWALVARRPLLAGAMAGLALGCGLYALAGVAALALAAGFRRDLGRFAAGVALTFGGVMLAFFAMAPQAFLDGVFRYHLEKPVKVAGRTPIFESANPLRVAAALAGNLAAYLDGKDLAKSLYYHALQALGLGIFMADLAGRAGATWLRRLTRPDGRPRDSSADPRAAQAQGAVADASPDAFAKLAVAATALFVLQWSAVNETYDFYQVPMLAFMAFLPAWAAWRVFTGVRDAVGIRDLVVPFTIVALLCLHVPIAHGLSRQLWPSEHAAAGNEVRYAWRDPSVLPGLARISRTLFFADSRVRGRVNPHYRHAMWNKMLTFTTVHEIADHVRTHSTRDETITGASTLAPLIALLADRRMAGDEADTNGKRFSSGNLTRAAFADRICGDRVRYVVGAPRSPFSHDFITRGPGLAEAFVPERTFSEPGLMHFREMPIRLYRRVEVPDAPPGYVCGQRGETKSIGDR